MGKNNFDIHDDELRIVGQKTLLSQTKKPKSRKYTWIAVLALAVLVLVLAALFWLNQPVSSPVYESDKQDTLPPLGHYTDMLVEKAYVEHLQDSINDIPLDIYIPHHALPELYMGVPDEQDESIVFATRAADVRADNGKIVGAFVLKGRPLSWGLSKKGYAGIIDGKLKIGVAENSSLFEEATEKEGYFFRQYPLVDNGVMIENEPKGKAIRKALCERNGEVMVVMSRTQESFHDFAQALADMQIDNAIYLVGTKSFGFYRDYQQALHIIYPHPGDAFHNENYLLWRTK